MGHCSSDAISGVFSSSASDHAWLPQSLLRVLLPDGLGSLVGGGRKSSSSSSSAATKSAPVSEYSVLSMKKREVTDRNHEKAKSHLIRG